MIAALAAGCSTTSTVTLLSTKNVDLSADHDVIARDASSTNGRMWLLFIPLGREPSAMRAANDLLEKHQGDYLTNVKVESSGFSLLALSFGSVSLKADVSQRLSAKPVSPAAPEAPPADEPAPPPAPESSPAPESDEAPEV